ncbi:MAG: DNA replication/repair protein RecF [Moorellales bacterium]
MHLVWLKLRNFRLYRQAEIRLAPGVNVVLGGNAQGKTSLLESIYFLVAGRGLGAGQQLISRQQPWTQVEAGALEGDARLVLRAALDRQRRRGHWINGVATTPEEIYRLLPAVAFWPQDPVLVHGEPQWRRRFLDGLLSRLSRQYQSDLKAYRRALVQRNACLRAGRPTAVEPWEEELAAYGARLTRQRLEALARLKSWAEEDYRALTGGGEYFSLEYRPRWLESPAADLEGQLLTALHRQREADRRLGHTRVGPHRDYFTLRIEGEEVRGWASRGQQKEVALALRLAQARLVAQALGKRPLLLLDDVFAEFDARRRRWLGQALVEWPQVLVTATDAALVPAECQPARTLEVEAGQVRVVSG